MRLERLDPPHPSCPAPLPQSLALAHTEVADSGVVMLSPWKEEDFRDGSQPWWA